MEFCSPGLVSHGGMCHSRDPSFQIQMSKDNVFSFSVGGGGNTLISQITYGKETRSSLLEGPYVEIDRKLEMD